MKKILSISLALLMLTMLCLGMVSCEQETAFGRYFSYLEDLEGQTDMVQGDGITAVAAQAIKYGEEETPTVMMLATIKASDATVNMALFIQDNTSTYDFVYSATSNQTGETLMSATGRVGALSYTGNDLLTFDTYVDHSLNSYYYETTQRGTATNMLKTLVYTMKPMLAKANVTMEDLYFVSVDIPELDNEAEVEEDLGGAFSAERWAYVGQMLVLGMGMVFLVLALLWVILLIFEKVMGIKKPDEPKKAEEPTPTPPVTVTQPVTPTPVPSDDAAVVAAITAAISAMIASDEQLSEEFAGGFRVVSFRKKSGRGAWND